MGAVQMCMHFSHVLEEYCTFLNTARPSDESMEHIADLYALDEITGRNWCAEELLPFLLDQSRDSILLPSGGACTELSQKLRRLSDRADERDRLKGIRELAVGYPIITGSIAGSTTVAAPLLCFSITLTYDEETGSWTAAHGEGAWISSTVAHAACAAAGTDEYPGELDFSSIDDIPFIDEYAFPEAAASLAASLGLFVSPDGLSGDIVPYGNTPAAPGPCVCMNSMVIGLFPRWERSIADDILHYARVPPASPAAELLMQDAQALQVAAAKHQVEESHACFVTPLDIAQERAVLAGSVGQSLAVTAPPGTGSSQVIVNIIADHLVRGKRTLVVSPHAEDLRTVFSRLQELSLDSRVMIVTDAAADRRRVCSSVKQLLESSADEADEQQYRSELLTMKNSCSQISHDIDKQLAKLDELHSLFRTAAPVGLTLHELYVNSSQDPSLGIDAIAGHPDIFGTIDKAGYEQIKAGFLEIRDSIHLLLPGHVLSSRSSCADVLPTEREDALLVLEHTSASLLDCVPSPDRLLTSWAAEVLSASQNPGAYGAEVLSLLDRVISEVKASQLLPPFDEEDEHEMRELLRELQGAHAWQPRFWRALRKLRRRSRGKEGVFSYGKRIRYSLYMVERLRSLGRSLEIHLPYGQKGEIAARLGKCRAEVQFYLDVWKIMAPLEGCLQPGKVRELYHLVLSGKGEEAVVFLREFGSAYREHFSDAEIVDQVLQKTHPLMREIIEAYIHHEGYDLARIQETAFRSIRNSLYIAQLRAVEREYANVLSLTDHMGEVPDFIIKSMQEKRAIIPGMISMKGTFSIAEYMSRDDEVSRASLREIWHAVQGARGGPPLRQVAVGSMSGSLLQLAPCWIMSPEAVSAVMPREVVFDTVIIDSASQISAPRALPVISRGKSAVCFGDEHLLAPPDGYVSLFRAADFTLPHMELTYCRGSSREELAAFPLSAWYGSSLLAAPNARVPRIPPITCTAAGDADNRDIAALSAEAARDLMSRYPEKTLAVIVWNKQELDSLEAALEESAGDDAGWGRMVRKKRREGNLCVCTVDEAPAEPRDNAVICIGSAVRDSLSDPQWAGKLCTMITRAREHLRVITSAAFDDLEKAGEEDTQASLLSGFLRFAQAVSSGDALGALPLRASAHTPTPFQKQILAALSDRGLEVHVRPGLTGFPLDLAVWNAQRQCYTLGIICEDIALTARENDICIPTFLASRGWEVMRVWSRNWWEDPVGTAERIAAAAQRQ